MLKHSSWHLIKGKKVRLFVDHKYHDLRVIWFSKTYTTFIISYYNYNCIERTFWYNQKRCLRRSNTYRVHEDLSSYLRRMNSNDRSGHVLNINPRGIIRIFINGYSCNVTVVTLLLGANTRLIIFFNIILLLW